MQQPVSIAPAKVPAEVTKPLRVKRWTPSDRLGQIIKQRAARLPIEREERYKAWVSGFETFRSEFSAVCTGFNEAFQEMPYRVRHTSYDILSFEKYESLLRGQRTPRTWLMGVEICSDRRSERFVYFFQNLSREFVVIARKSHFSKMLPPADVSLSLSRWSDGTWHRLRDEPIRLREVCYLNGQLVFLTANGVGLFDIRVSPLAEVIDDFLADAIAAFL